MEKSRLDALVAASKRVRRRIVQMTHRSRSAHTGTSLSAVDILVTLYSGVLNISPQKTDDPDRDRFILSKGHGCAALYATLVEYGYAKEDVLQGFSVDNGTLWGHVTWKTIPGIEISSGSLGHGLSIGLGMALAGKINGKKYRAFVVLGDGECDEGSVWEAALFAGHAHADNLVAIVDYNKIQSMGSTKEVLDLEPFADKWKAANWSVREIDGHDFAQLEKALSSVPFEKGKPSVIIAHTTKGKGVSFMENSLDWHYKNPDGVQLMQAIAEIGE